MAHGLASLFQLFLFTVHQFRILQFVVLELQEVGVLAVLLYVGPHLLHLAYGGVVFAVDLLVALQFRFVIGHDVDHSQLEILLTYQQVLVL